MPRPRRMVVSRELAEAFDVESAKRNEREPQISIEVALKFARSLWDRVEVISGRKMFSGRGPGDLARRRRKVFLTAMEYKALKECIIALQSIYEARHDHEAF